MTGRSAAERQEHRALVAAERKAEERYWNSPGGMRTRAAELRRASVEMIDSNDCDAMRRLAAGYEQRANEALRGSHG